MANVISLIDAYHQDTNLSSAIRLTVLEFYRDQNAFLDQQRSSLVISRVIETEINRYALVAATRTGPKYHVAVSVARAVTGSASKNLTVCMSCSARKPQ